MKRRGLGSILTILLCSTLLAVTVSRASAQNQQYHFSVDKEVVNVYWNADGTLSLDYVWTFTNQPGAHVLDFVDVGMPNGNFDIYGPPPTAAPTESPLPQPTATPANPRVGDSKQFYAEANGNQVSVTSDYQGDGSSGFSVDMGAYAIQPGQTGTVHVYAGGIRGVLYTDDTDSTYASAVFSPTWFGSQFVTGSTDLTVVYHLPPGVRSTEPRWHEAPKGFPSEPQTDLDRDGRITYTWQNANASGSKQYFFGASFPKTYVPLATVSGTTPSAVISVSSFSFDFGNFFGCSALLFFFVGIPALMYRAITFKKLDYMPPKVSIEGRGIKRGLTAVEAAILMEQPLDKVLTMILFGVLKKGGAQVVTRDPLELSFPKDTPASLYPYETDFILVFMEKDMFRRDLLSQILVNLVKSVSEKMKGFSRKETVDYYKSIMEDAWKQVEASDTPEVKSEDLNNNLEWMMLDKNYDDRSRRSFHGPIYVPTWWDRYDPTYRPSAPTSAGHSVSAPISSGNRALPGADFAASVVSGVQTFSTKIIGNVGTFTDRISNITNPPPPVSRSSSGGRSGGHSSGGGHSSCACACAGCACACAGGGR
jgi:hypothetical protein